MRKPAAMRLFSVLCLAALPLSAAGAPVMESADPAAGAINVPLDATVTAYFNEIISWPSVRDSKNPFIGGEFVGCHDVSTRGAGWSATPWDTTYYVWCRVRLDFPFVGEQVFATITDEVMSELGEALPHGYIWSFRLGVAQGSGVFDQADTLPVAADALAIIAADVNNDRILDMVTANRASNNISILYGNGDSTFRPAVHVGVNAHPEAVAATDLNRDLHTDLVVANRGANNLTLLVNNGDETFTPSTLAAGGTEPSSVMSADLNNDGYLDLAITSYLSNYVTVFLNDGTGAFPGSTNYYLSGATCVRALDYDRDYDLDLAVAQWSGPPGDSVSWVTVMTNDGTGAFSFDSTYEVGLGAGWIIAAELNGDLYPDLVATAHYEAGVSLLMNNGDGTFAFSPIGDIGQGPYTVRAADYNADGHLDLAVSAYYDNNVTILKGLGDGTFTKLLSYPTTPAPIGMAAGDFDGDGDMDLATAGNDQGNVTLLLNNELATAVSDQPSLRPQAYALAPNYPNPFNAATAIEYILTEPAEVRMAVFNVIGQRVRTLVDGVEEAGPHTVVWDGRSERGQEVSAGVYFLRFRAGMQVETMKMLLLK